MQQAEQAYLPFTVNGNTQTSPFATVAGTYTIVATDINGCTTSSIQTINEPTPLVLTASATNALCNAANGSLTFSATGGTGLFTYTVNGNIQTSPFATGAGIYTIVATDINGCTTSSIQTINEPTPIALAASATNALCNAANGSLTFNATGGTGIISYTVNGNAQTSPFATVAGIYTIVATDINGCTTSSIQTINEPTPVVLTASATNALCNAANGSLTFSATGGTGLFTYTVNGVAQVSPYSTTAGSYTVIATDANNCSVSSVFIITEPNTIVIGNPVVINTGCYGISNGTFQMSASGGSLPYVYTIDPIVTQPASGLFDNVTNGTIYTITVTDANLCTATTTVQIGNPLPNVTASASANPICLGEPTILNGGGAVSYVWTGGVNDGVSFIPLATTTYTVTGTDGNTCIATSTITINVNPLPVITSISANPADLCDIGNADLLVSAAITPPTYCQPVTSCTFPDIITNVTFAGINRTSTCDAPGGGGYSIYALPNPTVVAGASYPISVTTGGDVEGAMAWIDYNQDGIFSPLEAIFNGYTGTNPATYTGTANIPLGAKNGNTRMRVRCRYAGNPNGLVDPPCSNITFGETEDYIINITGGTGGATYTWSPATFLNNVYIDNPTATAINTTTTYTVTVEDGAGCTATSSVTVNVNPLPNITATASVNPLCDGSSTICTGAGAGIGGSYVWSGGVVDGVAFTPIATTTYTVTGTTANGCTATSTITIVVNTNPIILASASPSSICEGFTSTLSAIGATSYIWNPGALVGSPTVSPLATTTYSVLATDGNGCTGTSEVTVSVNPLPTVTASPASQTICENAQATVNGGGAVSYVWTGGISNGVPFTVTGANVYTVTGTDGNGCENTATAEVLMNAAPVINATATPSTTCNLTSVNPCATGAVSYVWTGGLSNCTPFVATTTDTYTVTGTDGAGCTGTSSVTVTVTPASGTLTSITSNQAQDHGDDFNINYYAANCDLIATVDDGAGGNVLGLTTSTVNVDAIAGFHNGQPFVRRWYQITPTTNGSADVKLYINQTDFDDYNSAVVAPYLPLPTGPGDASGIANIRITKNDDGGLGNNPIVITPAVSWNGTYWELSFNTPSFSQFRVHSVNPGNVPLPVTVTSFSGTKLESSDKLSWITSSEQNNAYFNLQHSTDGISFSTIAKVSSKAPNGNSNTPLSYTAMNNKPALGHNYYRLQQVDIDNKVSVHAQIVDLIWGANGSTVSIYPNPTTDILNIDLYATAAQNTTVKLLDMSGRVIRQVQAKSAVGMNNIQLSLGEIASGVYTVQVYENNHLTHTSKVKKND
ncbi:MAG: T9SS type A sorting domain-containing protein [Bacteroidetes bacterium]|nr:T9SS type A sorting domain-containing protein [Bacteroidota bacterium]